MLSLRTLRGLNLGQVRRMHGVVVYRSIMKASASYIDQNLMQIFKAPPDERFIDGATFLTLVDPGGFLVSNDIISTVFAAINKATTSTRSTTRY
jgi:hypothetical protein